MSRTAKSEAESPARSGLNVLGLNGKASVSSPPGFPGAQVEIEAEPGSGWPCGRDDSLLQPSQSIGARARTAIDPRQTTLTALFSAENWPEGNKQHKERTNGEIRRMVKEDLCLIRRSVRRIKPPWHHCPNMPKMRCMPCQRFGSVGLNSSARALLQSSCINTPML